MKYSFALAAVLQASTVVAFPAIAEIVASDAHQKEANVKRQGVPDPATGFNAAQQYVSTTGAHKFVAPNLAVDARGPCPGLNALANHGYLPHNGIGSHTDFVEATFAGFGMSADLSGFLTVLGASIDGNGLEWSIGGPNPALPGAPPLIGQPQGISASHNKYEADASPTRGDLYKFGNDYELVMSQWEQLYEMGQANGDNYDLELLNTFRKKRFDNSVSTNPYFFNGPFTGVLVAPAAFEFIYRFMGNKSAEYPAGRLNGAVLMDFFSIKKGANGKFIHTPGHERFPDNWYKRAIGDEYSIPFLNSDTTLAALRFPEFFTIGGNLGKVNTLTGIDPGNLTGGVLNAPDLLKGNNALCFAMEFAAQTAPDVLECSKVYADATSALSSLNKQLAISLKGLDCPKLSKLSMSQFSEFPGYKKLKCQSGKY